MIEETLSFRLLKAMKASRPAIWPVLAELGLHPGQELLLSQLWQHDGISQADLIAMLGVEPPTVSKALRRLEQSGYLRRTPGPGRSRTIQLTDAGWALREPVVRAWREADKLITTDLTKDETAQLHELLGRIARLD